MLAKTILSYPERGDEEVDRSDIEQLHPVTSLKVNDMKHCGLNEMDSLPIDNSSFNYINRADKTIQRDVFLKAIQIGLDFKLRDKIVDFMGFDELIEKLLEPLPITGSPLNNILFKIEKDLVPFCTNYASPHSMAFPDSGNSTASFVSDILISSLNQNLINWFPCAPVGTVIEMIVLNWFRELVRYPCTTFLKSPVDVGGFVTSGGVASNTIALLLAREKAFPGTMKRGMSQPSPKFSIIVPQSINHYSSRLSAGWLGLGEDNVVQCPVIDFKYDLVALEKLIRDLIKEGRKPFFLVCYAGDSRSLTIDDFKNLHDICDKYGLWLHVDGCHGTQLLFSQSLRSKLEGIELADSITFDPHKTLNVSYCVSILLIKNPKHLELIRRPEDIITGEEHSFGQLTPFFGSKPFLSLKLYILLKNSGLDGISKTIEKRCEMAKVLGNMIQNNNDLLLINSKIDMHSVIFMYCPTAYYQEICRNPELICELNRLNKSIQQNLLKKGEVWLHSFSIPDLSNVFSHGQQTMLRPLRFMSGNPILKIEDVERMLKKVCDFGAVEYNRLVGLKLKSVTEMGHGTMNVSKKSEVSQKEKSLRNNIGVTHDSDFLSWKELCERTTKIICEIRKFCCDEFSDDESFFVIVYGSYAYKLVRPSSDLDIVFCARNTSIERRNRIINFVKELHFRYGMDVDNEVPYESKILISYEFLQKACEAQGIFSGGEWNIPKIEKSREYLSSELLLLRFFIGVMTSPNIIAAGNPTFYNKLRNLATRNLIRAIAALNERKEFSSVSLAKDFCQSKNGEFGDFYLGFSYQEPFISYLVQHLEQNLCEMGFKQGKGPDGPIYQIGDFNELKPELLEPLKHCSPYKTTISAGAIQERIGKLTPSLTEFPHRYLKMSLQKVLATTNPPTTSKIIKPIFVVGCPRSGTTLVGSILSAHRNLVGSEESLFLLPLWQIFSDLFEGKNKRGFAPLQNYTSREGIVDSLRNFSNEIFGSLCKTNGQRYVDHTPWYVLLIPFIKMLYPDSVFVHVIRNGIDVVNSLESSYKKGFEWCGSDTKSRAEMWTQLVTIGKDYGSQMSESEYIELRYERLCDEPELEISQLLDKLGLEWDENCLHPLAVEHAGPSREGVTLATYDKDNLNVIKNRENKYFNASKWTFEDKVHFLNIAQDVMKRCSHESQISEMKTSVSI